MRAGAGTLACTAAGGLIVDVERERYRIAAEMAIERHAAANPTGRVVVMIQTLTRF